MNALRLAPAALALAAPVAAWFAGVRLAASIAWPAPKRRARIWLAVGTFVLGATLFAPAASVEAWIRALAGLPAHVPSTFDLGALVFAFVVVPSLEQGLKVAAVVPAWRSRHFQSPLDGMLYAGTGALGFVSAHGAFLSFSSSASFVDALRSLLAAPAHVFFAGAWGYALGRDAKWRAKTRRGRGGSRMFNATWLGATLFNGVYDHIVFERSPRALLATAPVLVTMGFLAFVALREPLSARGAAVSVDAHPRLHFLAELAPSSIHAVRVALSRTERPVMVRWIAGGAFVTAGVIMGTVAGAVALGRRAGFDFGSVDRAEAPIAATAPPLILVGSAVLLAFPIAGYLVARASATHSVLEPALAASLAIAGCLVLLGLAAPIALVFALAFTPVAFGLACAGAWIGVKR